MIGQDNEHRLSKAYSDIKEKYAMLKIKHRAQEDELNKYKRLLKESYDANGELIKLVEEMEDNGFLYIVPSETQTSKNKYVRKKSFDKLQQRMAVLNTYCRKLEMQHNGNK